ncbi:hypothetical protein, partial [Bartonella sp. AC134YNZD]|uniref:hypothetical protein n=1 Tax=Bartonella sp. AC134YNZD TaxID=3243446 RepID=UPI0035CF5DC8
MSQHPITHSLSLMENIGGNNGRNERIPDVGEQVGDNAQGNPLRTLRDYLVPDRASVPYCIILLTNVET